MTRLLRCSRCGKDRSEGHFHRDRHQLRGRSYACKECKGIWQRQYQQTPKYKLRAAVRQARRSLGLARRKVNYLEKRLALMLERLHVFEDKEHETQFKTNISSILRGPGGPHSQRAAAVRGGGTPP